MHARREVQVEAGLRQLMLPLLLTERVAARWWRMLVKYSEQQARCWPG